MHVVEHRTSKGNEGILSPWPEHTAPSDRDRKQAGPKRSDIFKTWFLVDSIEPVSPSIPLEDLEKLDGSPANSNALRNAFAVLRAKTTPQVPGLEALAHETNLSIAELKEIDALLRVKHQIIIEGPPGSGKTFLAQLFGRYFTGNDIKGDVDERLKIVQFHQSYSYEDFIEGIRPKTTDERQVVYEIEDGIFKKLCLLAREPRNQGKRFVLIIDEINRGNMSRIFGELLFLLEYRNSGTPVILPYSGKTLTIPSNIYLIGTMNTTDRSLAVIDYALRRRFYFYRLMPVVNADAPVLRRWLEKQKVDSQTTQKIIAFFVSLNTKVQQELGEHYQIGHSYFMTKDVTIDQGLTRIWQRAIMPLLEEYFFNRRDSSWKRAFEIDQLLGDGRSVLPEPTVSEDGDAQ